MPQTRGASHRAQVTHGTVLLLAPQVTHDLGPSPREIQLTREKAVLLTAQEPQVTHSKGVLLP